MKRNELSRRYCGEAQRWPIEIESAKGVLVFDGGFGKGCSFKFYCTFREKIDQTTNYMDLVLENKLLKSFLQISRQHHNLFHNLTESIYNTLNCYYCTLFSINWDAKSMSMISCKGCEGIENSEEYFVHDLEGSFTEHLLNEYNTSSYFSIENIKEHVAYFKHKSKSVLQRLDCKNCIAIFIRSDTKGKNNRKKNVVAVMYLYPKDLEIITPSIVELIITYCRLSFRNYNLARKEKLTQELIELHKENNNKAIENIFAPLVNDILKRYINYEGCSIFIWDPYLNRLNLSATTGILGVKEGDECYYQLGEGWTGHFAAKEKRFKIMNSPFSKKDEMHHKRNYVEIKKHPCKSALFIPILNQATEELLGIIRMVNPLNPIGNVVDFFSETDAKLLEHACYIISLYMEFYRSERLMYGFASQITHELLTPAIGIKGVAERLVRNRFNSSFLDRFIGDYSKSIYDYTLLQIALADSIKHAWEQRNKPKAKRYPNIVIVDIKELLESCKKLVIPIARDAGVQFDNIKILGEFPKLFVDKSAFKSVFLNLFTNSLKYRKQSSPEEFSISVISGRIDSSRYKNKNIYLEKGEYMFIRIADQGMGIPLGEEENIFKMGFRAKDVDNSVVRGLGIGLAVVKNILEDFYCNIHLANNKNPTIFEIIISNKLLSTNFVENDDWNKIGNNENTMGR